MVLFFFRGTLPDTGAFFKPFVNGVFIKKYLFQAVFRSLTSSWFLFLSKYCWNAPLTFYKSFSFSLWYTNPAHTVFIHVCVCVCFRHTYLRTPYNATVPEWRLVILSTCTKPLPCSSYSAVIYIFLSLHVLTPGGLVFSCSVFLSF